MEIKLGPLTISQDRPPVFIVECGINHNGSHHLALKLINAAKETGAQIVKFQHHLPSEEMLEGHPLWNVLTRTAINIGELQLLKQYAESMGLVFLCTPFSFKAADELDGIGIVGFKMGSGELNNIPLQRHVVRKGKPMLVSTGMSSLREVRNAVRAVALTLGMGRIDEVGNKLVLMNCCSTYPATPAQSRLHRLDALRQIHGGLVGQSDHTPTISTCLGAIARGAVVIEKHMTLDRGMEGPDHAASITPAEFKQMVEMGNEIWEANRQQYGRGNDVLEKELPVRGWANHSLVTNTAIFEGETITDYRPEGAAYFGLKPMLTTKRPGDGVPASKWDEVVGKRATKYLPPNHKLEEGDYV